MSSREQEFREIFKAESLEYYESLGRLITDLEKNPNDDALLAEIFRLLHNLKANSKAVGSDEISDIAHKLETVFGLIRSKQLPFEGDIVIVLFDGIDLLGSLITNIDNPSFEGTVPELIDNLDKIIGNVQSGNIELQGVKKYYNSQNISLSDLIYIKIKKLDDILNLVGELIIDKDRIVSLGKEVGNDELKSISSHLHRITNELQAKVMDARLINIGALFNKFPRIVRDVATVDSKLVDLEIIGQDVEIDRNILQIITDSLLHIVRNAISHGIEPPHERENKNKPKAGLLKFIAQNDKDTVWVQIVDDGRGIDVEKVRTHAVEQGYISSDRARDLNDSEVFSFIFEPGFSLSKEVNEVSGRGVGLDVVKNAVDSIGGKIHVESKKDKGTTFSLYIPTSMAVKGALLFQVNNNSYAIPLIHTVYVFTVTNDEIHQVGLSMVLDIKTEVIPLILMRELFNSNDEFEVGSKEDLNGYRQDIIIVSYNNRKVGLIVDKFLRQQDIVVKPLQEPVANIDLFGGVTLLGTGEVCLVLDIPSITRNFINNNMIAV